MEIINLKKQKMKLLTQEQQESYENAKICYFCRENFESKFSKDKKYRQVRDHCHYTSKIKRKYQHDDKNCWNGWAKSQTCFCWAMSQSLPEYNF